jgi:hypothetical protein
MSRKDMAILLDEIIYQLQTEQIPLSTLTDQDIEKLEALIIELIIPGSKNSKIKQDHSNIG